jgi:hypothetical protein
MYDRHVFAIWLIVLVGYLLALAVVALKTF